MKSIYILILFLVTFTGNIYAQTVDQKLALISNSRQIGGEFVIGYQIKGTNLAPSKTLASIDVDIVYDTTLLRYAGGTDWSPQLSDSNGYVKRIKNNMSEIGTFQSVRIIVTAPYLNDSGYISNTGYDLQEQYATIVIIHFTILSNTGTATLTIKNITNQAGLFVNPGNQPNTFDVASMTLSDPVIINEPLPVEITSFTSAVMNNDVKLIWKTSFEMDNQGFEIQRTDLNPNSDWTNLGYVSGHGTTQNSNNYAFEDKNIRTGKYKYRLKQNDYNGNFKYFDLNNNVEIGVPLKFDVSQNYPNPFNPITKIDYQIPENGKVKLIIYDILGREIKNVVNETKEGGYYSEVINAGSLSSGVYMYRLTFEGNNNKFTITKKMSLIK
jgi:hypothetical protein